MFLTFTIDTKQKKRHFVRFNTKNFNPFGGWRKPLGAKKRSLWQRIKSWRRSLKDKCYKLGGQIAMF